MQVYGGGFVKALAEAGLRADADYTKLAARVEEGA